jgi:hypothetical protein
MFSPLATRALYRFQSSGRWFFGARLFLVAPCAADAGIEAELGDRIEQGHRLVLVARFVGGAQHDAAARDRFVDRAHDQPLAQFGNAPVAEFDDLGKIVSGVHVQQREREARRAEGLDGQVQQHDRVLAAGKKQRRVRALAGHLAQDVDGLGLEPVQVGQRVRGEQGAVHVGAAHARTCARSGITVPAPGWSPHSLADSFSHHQRPARMSSPTATARVQGAQPMLG